MSFKIDNFISINFCILGKNSVREKSTTEKRFTTLKTCLGVTHFFESILKHQ